MFDIFDKYWQRDIRSTRLKRPPMIEDWEHGIVHPNDPSLPDSTNISGGSLGWLYLLCSLAMVVMIGRYLILTQVHGQEFLERANNNHSRAYITRSLRGVMYDRQGVQLVENIPRDNASIIPADLPRDRALRRNTIETLSTILDVPYVDIQEKIAKYEFLYYPITLKEAIDHETKLQLLFQFPDHQYGVVVTEDFYRSYPFHSLFSHVIGYLGKVSREEWERIGHEARLDSEIGKTGLESSYEDYLRGDPGERLINVNAQGNFVNTQATSEPVPGCDLTLTLDANLQEHIRTILEQTRGSLHATGGVVIVMDPRNGEILSLVSLPDFDHNLFSNGIVGEEEGQVYAALNANTDTPFLNRAIGGVYPPGSVFKLVTASSGLSAGVISEGTLLNSPGLLSIPNQFNPEEHFVYRDWKAAGHGRIAVADALAESSDTFFYQVAGGYEGFRGMGIDQLRTTSLQFGLGHTLGIDLPGEVSGTIPDEAWKLERIGASWYVGDTYNAAIGQGYILTTPLQVASFTSVVANGGTLYRPTLLRETLHCDGAQLNTPLVLNNGFVPADDLRIVRRGMRLAVLSDDGTAKAFRDFPIPIAGKTGTAQFNNNEQEHAWFTAFAPYENPEVVVTVLVEGGGEGGETALPIAREVLREYFKGRNE